jgi:hypothetical protein
MGCHCQRLARGEQCGLRTVPAAGRREVKKTEKLCQLFELFGLFMRGRMRDA